VICLEEIYTVDSMEFDKLKKRIAGDKGMLEIREEDAFIRYKLKDNPEKTYVVRLKKVIPWATTAT
jgi:hypothetical protein